MLCDRNNLLSLRRKLGWTQMELSIKAKCSMDTLVKIEKYGYVPTAPTRFKIAKACGVAEDQIWHPGDLIEEVYNFQLGSTGI